MPAVSIIVPVYNTAPYLKECLDSLIRQTLCDIEIVCVDDGSTDGSLAVLRAYAQQDARIMVVEQPHAGVSVARNRGVDHSAGNYLVFVDSDDWVESDFCKIPYEVAEQTEAEIVFFGWCFRHDRKIKSGSVCKNLGRTKVYENSHIPRGALSARATVCGQFWRRAFWRANDILFPEDLRLGEDSVALFIGVMAVQRVACVSNVLYNYYQREDSAGHGADGWSEHVAAVTAFVNYIRERFKQTREYDRIRPWITSVALHCYRYVYFFVATKDRQDCAAGILNALTREDWELMRTPGVLAWPRRLFYYAIKGNRVAAILNMLVMARAKRARDKGVKSWIT
jgi:Glycosyltransferases involved in cell wall biogenesis